MRFDLRSVASPLTIAAFIVSAVTGLCMFFGYRGNLINPMHEIFTLIFVCGSVLHIIVNWKAVVAHIRRPLGAVLTGLFVIITAVAVIPTEGQQANRGNPARTSVALMMDADLSVIAALTKNTEPALMDRLRQYGLATVAPGATVRQIADGLREDPMELLTVLLAGTPADGH